MRKEKVLPFSERKKRPFSLLIRFFSGKKETQKMTDKIDLKKYPKVKDALLKLKNVLKKVNNFKKV